MTDDGLPQPPWPWSEFQVVAGHLGVPLPRAAGTSWAPGGTQRIAKVLGVGPAGSGNHRQYHLGHLRRWAAFHQVQHLLGSPRKTPWWLWRMLDEAGEGWTEPWIERLLAPGVWIRVWVPTYAGLYEGSE